MGQTLSQSSAVPKPIHSFNNALSLSASLGEEFFSWLEQKSETESDSGSEGGASAKERYATKSQDERIALLNEFRQQRADEDKTIAEVESGKLYLLWALWHDKKYAMQIHDEYTKADKNNKPKPKGYSRLQTKAPYRKNMQLRRSINAGLHLLLLEHLRRDPDYEEGHDQRLIAEYLESNKPTFSTDFVTEYTRAQYAMSRIHERHKTLSLHRMMDKIIAACYAFCSGIMKGTAAVVVFLTFAISPPVWVAIPLFLALFAVLNLNMFEPNKPKKSAATFVSSFFLTALCIVGVVFFPAAPWFFISLISLIGFVAAMQSYQMVTNIYEKSRQQNNHGGILQEFLYRKRNGKQVSMTPLEKGLVWGVCAPIAFSSAFIFTFIGYQALMFFIASMAFMAVFAAWPAAPFIIFGFVMTMQIFSSLTAFRFCKKAYLKLADLIEDLSRAYDAKLQIIRELDPDAPRPSKFRFYLSAIFKGIDVKYTVQSKPGEDNAGIPQEVLVQFGEGQAHTVNVTFNKDVHNKEELPFAIKGVAGYLRQYRDSWRKSPVRTFFKTTLGVVLFSIAVLYTYVGAKVSSVSFMIFSNISLTSMHRAIGILAGLVLTIPIQVVFSYRSNIRLYDMVNNIASSIKKWFIKEPAPEQDPNIENVEKAVQHSDAIHNAFDRTRSTTNMLLNVLGKTSLKMNPHTPIESIPNMAVEAVNALTSGLLGIKSGREQKFFDKDVAHISDIVTFNDDAAETKRAP